MKEWLNTYNYIDPAIIREIGAGEVEFVEEIIIYFIDNHGNYFNDFVNAVHFGAREGILFQAHKMKGLFKIISSHPLVALTEEMEAYCEAGNVEDLLSMFEKVVSVNAFAIAELKMMLAELRSIRS